MLTDSGMQRVECLFVHVIIGCQCIVVGAYGKCNERLLNKKKNHFRFV